MKHLTLLLALATGCTESTVAKSWEIDRMRILAVRSSVLDENGTPTMRAEASPGDRVQLASLTVHPEFESPHVIWTGCLSETADMFGCIPTDDEDGFLGIEPFFPPEVTIAEDVLDGMTEEEKQEGLSYMFNLIAVPDIDEVDDDIDPESFSNDEEIAYKRMPVSLAETPNNNPFIQQILIEKNPLILGTTMSVSPGQAYQIEPVLAYGPEEYVFTNSSGEQETRTEEPYFAFYSTEGSFDRPYSGYDDNPGVSWTAPKDPIRSEVRLWVVVRDGRGGMGWLEQVLLVE